MAITGIFKSLPPGFHRRLSQIHHLMCQFVEWSSPHRRETVEIDSENHVNIKIDNSREITLYTCLGKYKRFVLLIIELYFGIFEIDECRRIGTVIYRTPRLHLQLADKPIIGIFLNGKKHGTIYPFDRRNLGRRPFSIVNILGYSFL